MTMKRYRFERRHLNTYYYHQSKKKNNLDPKSPKQFPDKSIHNEYIPSHPPLPIPLMYPHPTPKPRHYPQSLLRYLNPNTELTTSLVDQHHWTSKRALSVNTLDLRE